MTEYRWKDGYHAPKNVKANEVWEALQALPEPTPEALYEATKDRSHPLHDAVWTEGDQEWARRGRLTFCRRVIASIERVELRGKKTIVVRAAEFVTGRWVTVEDIAEDADLRDAYFDELQKMLDNASRKIEAARMFLRKK